MIDFIASAGGSFSADSPGNKWQGRMGDFSRINAALFPIFSGAQVQGVEVAGTVVGARCPPANQLTQYWVRKANGERFWVTGEQLKRL
jgi:hypothetical protein